MDYRVQLIIPKEIYEKWKRHQKSLGVDSWGRYSSIVRVNSDIFIKAIEKEMDQKQ